MQTRFLKKLTNSLVILSLISFDLARANPALISAPSPVEAKPALDISIPAEFGMVRETYLPEENLGAPVIFHLETAHANYEAALKIKEILKVIEKKYQVGIIFSEGGTHELRSEFSHFFDDPKLNAKMLDALAEKGELTGVDLALADSGFLAIGVERPGLYRRTYKDFKKVILNLNESEALIEGQKRKLDKDASQIFSPALRELLETWQKFESNHLDFGAVVKFLNEKSKESLKLDLADPFSQFDWPGLSRLVTLQEMERRLDVGKFETEKAKLKMWLREKKVSEDLIRAFDFKEINSPRAFFENFLRRTHSLGFQFKDYPQVTYWAASQVLQSELDAKPLFAEIEKLFQKLFDAEAAT